MKTKLTETKFESAIGRAGQLFRRIACLGAFILICSSASAQNLFVSGNARLKNCRPPCGVIYKFSWDGGQSIFAAGLNTPWDVAFDSAGNLFVVDYDGDELFGKAAVYKITPNGVRTTFASGLSYPSYLGIDNTGNIFVVDAASPLGRLSVNDSRVSPFSQYRVANEELDWIGRLTSTAPVTLVILR